jgi:hypothetical protein
MAYNARKTEHAGPKKGAGAYYGRKSIAKKVSNRRRRENDKHEISTHGTSAKLRRQLDLLEFASARPPQNCVGFCQANTDGV